MFKDMIKNNWFALNVVTFRLKTVQSMALISYNLNVNFVAQQLNGFVGEILIFVSPAIKNNAMETMYQNIQNNNCPNVKALANVLLVEIMV